MHYGILRADDGVGIRTTAPTCFESGDAVDARPPVPREGSRRATDAVNEPVELRGHHLVCMHFLHGDGYSADFALNMLRLRGHAEDAGVIVGMGRDAVCAVCPSLDESGTCEKRIHGGIPIEELDRLARHLLGLAVGESIGARDLERLITGILPEWRASVCASCDGAHACSTSIDLMIRAWDDPIPW